MTITEFGIRFVDSSPVVAELNLFVVEIDGGFVASIAEAEGVVFFDFPGGLGVKEFVAVFGRGQEANASQIDAEAVDWFHADGIVFAAVVFAFDPEGELSIESLE
jgi:hypothetical protein